MRYPRTVEEQISATFVSSQRSSARHKLPAADQLDSNAPYARVLIAILQLASGDLDRLDHFATEATKDWRDVLYWAETPPDPNAPKSFDELQRRIGRPKP